MSDVQDVNPPKPLKKSTCYTIHFMMLLQSCNTLRSCAEEEHACFIRKLHSAHTAVWTSLTCHCPHHE